MRHLFFFLCLFGPIAFTFSQPVFDHLPVVSNHTIVQYKADAYTGADPALESGVNQTWDYSTLNLTHSFGDTLYTDMSRATLRDTFPDATFYERQSDHSEFYYKISGDTLYTLGAYTPDDTAVSFYAQTNYEFVVPMNYGEVYDDTTLEFISYHHHPHYEDYEYDYRKVTYDGYGTLILSSGTLSDIFRIKMVDSTQSASSDHFVFTSYVWMYPGEFTYRFFIQKTDTYHGNELATTDWGAYSSDATTTAVHKDLHALQAVLYPQPASEYVKMSASQLAGDYEVSIQNMQGETVLATQQVTAVENELTLNVQALKSGMYLLKITDSENVYDQKLVIR